jgi:hypothetical protein
VNSAALAPARAEGDPVSDLVEPAKPTDRRADARRIQNALVTVAPLLVCALQLVLGYRHYSPGTAVSLSGDHYRAWAFPLFRYSDVIWLYLRDRLDSRPIPYVDFPLEYPPLTGVASWAAAWSPDLPGYFLASYVVLSAAMLGAVWALTKLPGANPWFLAAAPAVFFYTGHQWDPLAIGTTAVSLVAIAHGRDRLGAVGLAAAVSLKLFPLAFLAALCVERVRQRAWRRLAEIVAIAIGVSVSINAPFALANLDGWGFFFRWNRDRLADSGPWVLLRGVPTEMLTTASLLAAVVGAAVLAFSALRLGGPLVVPLGATALLWWLLVNKTFTTHLMLWVLLAIALLRPPVWLWLAVVLVDVAGFQLGNFLNLYNVPLYQSAPLVHQAVERMYDPLQVVRSLVLLACVGWGVRVIWLNRGSTPRLATAAMFPRLRSTPAGLVELAPQLPAPHRRSGRLILMVGPPTLFLAASVMLTWPLAAQARSATVVGFDPLLQIWLSQWVQHAMSTEPRALWGANVFHPFADTLAYTDANLPGAILAWPLDLLFSDPLLTNAAMILLAGAIGGLGVHALVARLTGNLAAGLIAGLAWMAMPFRAIHLWHLNWLQGAWLPWVALALILLLRRPTFPRAAAFGAISAVLVLTSFYFALQIAILAGAVVSAAVAARPAIRHRKLAATLLVAGLVAGVLVAPVIAPYVRVRAEQGLERSLAEAEQYKAHPASWWTLPPWDEPNQLQRVVGIRGGENDSLTTVGQERHADGHRHGELVIEDALYPGVFVLAAAAFGIAWGRPRWLMLALTIVAAVAFLLSLGPSLGDGVAGARPLPYRWLFDHVPGFTAMRVPARLGGLGAFALVVLSGFGIAAGWSRVQSLIKTPVGSSASGMVRLAGPLLAVVVAGVIAMDLASGAPPLEPIDRSTDATAVYDWLATQPPGAVMEFPAESIFLNPAGSSVRRHVGLSMFWSTRHWKPLVNGNSGFIPRAHSELLETFVGNLPRPDGSIALRLSHVSPDRVHLLRQLGVRYLVFHRTQYRPEDWPAVNLALRQNDSLSAVSQPLGNASVWLVRETLSPAELPDVDLHAPTLLAPGDAWAPAMIAHNLLDGPSLLSLTEPARASVEWFSGEGRFIRKESLPITLPPILTHERILCTMDGCRAAPKASVPNELPDPAESAWRPIEPGHYVARVSLSGDTPISCTVDLDVVSSATVAARLTSGARHRWATCEPGDPVPMNDPGRPTLRVLGPSVTFADGALAVSGDLDSALDEEIRGWIFLAPPGDPEPWRRPAWTSNEQQALTTRDAPAAFAWLERPNVPSGVYGLSIWFHRAVDGGWRHAAGGDFGLPAIVVDRDGMRWAGPTRISPRRANHLLYAQSATSVPLTVVGLPDDAACIARWRLLREDGGLAAAGGAGACANARVALPAEAPTGRYLLQVDAVEASAVGMRLSDGVAIPVVVAERRSGPR